MSHLTFGPTLNIADVIKKKNSLNKVKHTVYTRSDGSRYSKNNDNDTITEIPRDTSDENGNWAIMDEASALGLSATAEDEVKEEVSSSSTEEVGVNRDDPTKLLATLIKQHPQLAQYLILIKVGVPATAIRSKMFAEGVADALPEGVAQTFCEAIGAAKDLAASAPAPPTGTPMEGDHSEMHGHLGDISWEPPSLASFCDTPARAGYNTEKGHEYLDSPLVLREKVKLLAAMLTKANKPVIYAGAGLSTASGIGDYATQTGQSGVLASSGQRGANVSPFCVAPNYGHHAIAALAKKGLVYRFVQQNHDGLPQKAGMSQGLINEIHGGWFDPSNPVVAMSGGLRSDLFEDLLQCERETDLVIAVGSSLCGMNADRLVSTSANRAKKYRQKQSMRSNAAAASSSMFDFFKTSKSTVSEDEQFGSVIISLQKTVHDHNSSLRIFALIDDVFKLLAEELELDMSNIKQAYKQQSQQQKESEEEVFMVPYDEDGLLDTTKSMRLDLSEGAEITVTSGPDKGARGVMIGKNKDGHYRLSVERRFKNGQRTFTETRLLGGWWPHEALRGEVNYIPVMNR